MFEVINMLHFEKIYVFLDWLTFSQCLYEAAKYHKISLLDLYCEALDPGLDMENIFKMPSSDYGVVGQPSKLHVGGLICRAIRKVR